MFNDLQNALNLFRNSTAFVADTSFQGPLIRIPIQIYDDPNNLANRKKAPKCLNEKRFTSLAGGLSSFGCRQKLDKVWGSLSLADFWYVNELAMLGWIDRIDKSSVKHKCASLFFITAPSCYNASVRQPLSSSSVRHRVVRQRVR